MDLRTAGIEYLESAQNVDLYELQIIDASGKIILSSTGFEYDDAVAMPDYELAKVAENGIAKWKGKNTGGEKILCFSKLLERNEVPDGEAVRLLVSLEPVNRRIFLLVALISVIGFFMLFFVLISGTYFINSIVNPVRQIGTIADKIAKGDFTVMLKKDYDDEIGDLCDIINNMSNELAASEKMKNEFISSVSHELRTPLTAIKGWGETIMACGTEDTETFQRGMKVIISESERLSGLVEDLLDFSHMQTGRMSMNFDRLDILAELGEAVYLFTERANQEKKHLVYSEPDNMSYVLGDANRLKQVFVNIIDNAVKYTDEDGTIMVTATEQDGYAIISVSDTGCGISEADLSKVKERFYKANTTRRGFGIGLAVADEIVSMHSGELNILSKEGIGTTVTIKLPVIPVRQDTASIDISAIISEKERIQSDEQEN
ncbi:MAG: HAMP domain-containing histidine kinase [Clostridia bacterium]|nr:HAMP domain-containing histidine kinase [Clostridia bacterium]